MAKDVVVVVNLDSMPNPAERLDILLVSTTGEKPIATYRSLDEILAAFPAQAGINQKIYRKAEAMFNQGKTTLADSLIRKVKIVGFNPPTDNAGSYPVFGIAFGTPQFDTPLEPETSYWVQIGGHPQAVVQVDIGTTAPTTAPQMAQLFNGATFTLNGVVFSASVGSGGTVTFTGDSLSATVPLTPTVAFFADDALSANIGLADAAYTATYTNGNAQTAPAQTLIQNIKDLQEEDNDWYLLLTDQDGDDFVTALAAFAEESEPTEAELGAGIEDMRKFYFGQTDNLNLVGNYARSAIIYVDTENLNEEADAAYVGNVGPFWPQSVTWKFKLPQGITMPDISDAQRQHLEDANVNFLTEEYKHQYVKNGTCWNGEFIDTQMGADYIAQSMREELYRIFLTNANVPYTDTGFALVASAVFGALNRAVDLNIIALDPESNKGVFNVIVPKRASATDDQARNRQMPDIVWEALLEGSVHGIKTTGTLRVNLGQNA